MRKEGIEQSGFYDGQESTTGYSDFEGSELTSTNPYEDTEVIEGLLDSKRDDHVSRKPLHGNKTDGPQESLHEYEEYLDKELFRVLSEWDQQGVVATTGNEYRLKLPLPEPVSQGDIGKIWHIEEEENILDHHFKDGDVSIRPRGMKDTDSYHDTTTFVYTGEKQGREAIKLVADAVNRFWYHKRDKYREESRQKNC